jgi:hypothetical protein
MLVSMANVPHLGRTQKDFRHYPNLEPMDFTRIHDQDLSRIWGVLNDVHGVCGQPRFDRSSTQVKLREVLAWGNPGRGHNKTSGSTAIVPRVERDPEEVVTYLFNWKHALETARDVGPMIPAELLMRIDHMLMRPMEA